MNTDATWRIMANDSDLPRRDKAGAKQRMEDRRLRDAIRDDKQGFSVNDPTRDRPSHPDGWQRGGRDENG